ncbi:sugar phosphate isomerase/epimerase family protein [Amnibacterium endophyticum]|uniref:Sugar phosphate isomerase/epimerase family protein n=1 Tax=Amnibacterium endophyticum TaxID=2109337 RepID=A0ABW4LAM7_9MICO
MNNPLGIHALVFAGGTTTDEVDTITSGAHRAGYDIIEFSLHGLADLDTTATRAMLEDRGLTAICSRGLAPDADVSSDDLAVVQRGAELLHESLQATAAIGGIRLTGALYSAFGKAAAPLTGAGRRNVIAVLKDLAVEARRLDVVLGLEVCNRYETNVVNTAGEALRLADEIGEDNVDVHLDIYHMNIEEKNFRDPVLLLGDRLGYVHVGENDRGYLGSGHLDFDAFFDALREVDYRGGITFESFSSAVVSPTLSNDLSIWRNLWTDSDDLAAAAHRFLAERLARVPA